MRGALSATRGLVGNVKLPVPFPEPENQIGFRPTVGNGDAERPWIDPRHETRRSDDIRGMLRQ
jgi:hypothetical protein